MSSLVMLSAMPIFNNNNAAMAQGYGAGYGDSSYSTYPTDVNKYECRTGPLEGFFVSSVEFCKFTKFDKDDDRKDVRDNRTGTQGPPGPQGIQGLPGSTGATGATGPAGITTLNSTNLYLNSSTNLIPSGESGSTLSVCDEGDAIVNGGYFTSISDPINNKLTVFTATPFEFHGLGFHDGYGVSIAYSNATGSVASVRVFTECFDNPPAHIP